VTIYFYEPSAEHKAGGLEAAITGLRSALQRAGQTVETYTGPVTTLPADPESVVHFHGIWQSSYYKIARDCRERNIPYVVSPHGALEPWAWKHKLWKKWPYFHLIEKKHLSGANCLFATSIQEAGNLKRIFRNREVATLPLGLTGKAQPDYVEARRGLGWSDDEWVLLYLSRIHPVKGLDLLFKALANSQGQIPPTTRLVIVGGGEASFVQSLQDWSKENQQSLPRVEWIGEVWGEERWKYFQGADLFCLPSHSENFGLAVLDACQVGTPALTTGTTPWGRLLEGGRGYIADPEVEVIEKMLAQFFGDGKWDVEKRAALSDWAWGTFDWDVLAKQYIDVYQKMRSRK
jgi:glycosyltransferase involved in cell wall biosynthesis